MTDRYTVHDTRVEDAALIRDPDLPWIVRKNDRCPIVLSPRYASQAEAECAALGLNHADGGFGAFSWFDLLAEEGDCLLAM